MKKYSIGFLGLGLFYAAFAIATPSRDVRPLSEVLPMIDTADMGNSIQGEHPMLNGDFGDQRSLASGLCPSGNWSYNLTIGAPLNNLELNLQEDNSLVVVADFGDIEGHVNGTLRNRLTFCREVGVGSPFGADGARVNAKITFLGDPNDLSNIQVRIQSTHIDHLHFKSWVPQTIQNFLTDMANSTLNYVWKTRIGTWVGDYITKKIKDGGLPGIGGGAEFSSY